MGIVYQAYPFNIPATSMQQILPENPNRVALFIYDPSKNVRPLFSQGSLTAQPIDNTLLSSSFTISTDPSNTFGWVDFLHVPTNALTLLVPGAAGHGVVYEGIEKS